MHANPKGSTAMSRQLMISAADTRLYAVDTLGGTPALLFLSGGFGTMQNWSRVIRRLDGKYRTVRFRRAGAREVGQIGRLLRTGGRRRHRTGHRRDRYRTPDPRRVVSRRHDRGAIRGSAPRAGRRTGAHRRCLPDRHVRRGRKAEGPHPVPSVGVDHAHPGSARPLGPDVSRRVRGRRDRDGRRQRRTRDPTSRRWNARPCSWLAPEPTRAPPRTRCARCALLPPTPRRATSACPYSQRRPTSTRRSSTRPPTPWSPRSRTSFTSLPDYRIRRSLVSADHVSEQLGEDECGSVLEERADDLDADRKPAGRSANRRGNGGEAWQRGVGGPERLVGVSTLAVPRRDRALFERPCVVGERRREVGRADEHVDVAEVVAPCRPRCHPPVLLIDEFRPPLELGVRLLKGEEQLHVIAERFVFPYRIDPCGPALDDRGARASDRVYAVRDHVGDLARHGRALVVEHNPDAVLGKAAMARRRQCP